MKTISDLAEVKSCLDKSADDFVFQDNLEELDHYEALCIRVLDSEFDDYPDGILETFLHGYLAQTKIRLGLNGV